MILLLLYLYSNYKYLWRDKINSKHKMGRNRKFVWSFTYKYIIYAFIYLDQYINIIEL
jgi:hypothetical protein